MLHHWTAVDWISNMKTLSVIRPLFQWYSNYCDFSSKISRFISLASFSSFTTPKRRQLNSSFRFCPRFIRNHLEECGVHQSCCLNNSGGIFILIWEQCHWYSFRRHIVWLVICKYSKAISVTSKQFHDGVVICYRTGLSRDWNVLLRWRGE